MLIEQLDVSLVDSWHLLGSLLITIEIDIRFSELELEAIWILLSLDLLLLATWAVLGGVSHLDHSNVQRLDYVLEELLLINLLIGDHLELRVRFGVDLRLDLNS